MSKGKLVPFGWCLTGHHATCPKVVTYSQTGTQGTCCCECHVSVEAPTKAECQLCFKMYSVNKDGSIRKHKCKE